MNCVKQKSGRNRAKACGPCASSKAKCSLGEKFDAGADINFMGGTLSAISVKIGGIEGSMIGTVDALDRIATAHERIAAAEEKKAKAMEFFAEDTFNVLTLARRWWERNGGTKEEKEVQTSAPEPEEKTPEPEGRTMGWDAASEVGSSRARAEPGRVFAAMQTANRIPEVHAIFDKDGMVIGQEVVQLSPTSPEASDGEEEEEEQKDMDTSE